MATPVPDSDLPPDLRGTPVPTSDLPPDVAPPSGAKSVTVTPKAKADPLAPTGEFVHEVPRAVLQNMGAQVAGGYAGLAGSVLPGPTGQGANWAKNVSGALSYQPESKTGKSIMDVLGIPGHLIEKLGSKVGDRGAEVSPALGTIGKTSTEILPQLIGARAGLKKRTLTPEQERVAAARDAGFKMTPDEMGAGPVPSTIASLAGEPRLAKLTSKKNAAVATAKAKQELGLKATDELSLDTLKDIRTEAGRAYENARGIGEIQLDAKYISEVQKLGDKYRSAAKDFPGLVAADVEKLISAALKEDPAIAAAKAQGIKIPPSAARPRTFDANSGIDVMSTLREGADKAFRSGDTGLAKVMRGIAEQMEAQIERHLAQTGQADILANFRAGREQIAKSYAVEKALVGEQVSPQALGKQVAKRKPLTGGLKETGDFARTFERSSQKPSHMATGPTLHDAGYAALRALRDGVPGLGMDLAFIGARPAARHALASRPGQWAMDPRTNLHALEALGVATIPRPEAIKNEQEKKP